MDPRFLFLSSSLILGATFSISVAERTAHCKIKWLFGISCSNVSQRLVSQIKAWQISRSCQFAGEWCSYETPSGTLCYMTSNYYHQTEPKMSDCTQFEMSRQLVSSAPNLIKATHTSPRTKKVNDLQFLIEQLTVCKVTGEAVSELSADPADNSTNYCSLQNLMDGSALSDAEGYKQFSNKWICPGFDAANCTLL